jgi:hypothetical protein
VGFSIGSGLVSIAQGAADQANTAIQNQHEAGGQAAFQAKNNLAQNAAAAAATAQAALAGKQVIVSNLEQQARDAQGQVDAEAQQLTQAQRAALATQQSAQHAQAQVRTTTVSQCLSHASNLISTPRHRYARQKYLSISAMEPT